MNNLTIYYSIFGNNKKIASEIANSDGSELIEFAPGSFFRVFSFFWGKKRLFKKASTIDTESYSQINICGPIWAGKPAPAVMKLLEALNLDGKMVTCHFTYTQDYTDTETIVKDMVKNNGGNLANIEFIKIKEEKE